MKAKERHEIKTDRFLDTIATVEEFILKYAKMIGLGIGFVVVVVALWIGSSWFFDSRENSAAIRLNKVTADFINVQNSASIEENNFLEVEKILTEIANETGGTAGSIIAKHYLGLLYVKNENYEEAEKAFRSVIDSRHPVYWGVASSELGNLFMKEGKYQDAVNVFCNVADSGINNMPLALFSWKTGLCYEKIGDNAQALLYFNKAKDSETLTLNSLLSTKIERKIQEMSGKQF